LGAVERREWCNGGFGCQQPILLGALNLDGWWVGDCVFHYKPAPHSYAIRTGLNDSF
jgi:hypothetical protein